MRIIGLAGWSGAGKTTLVAKLIPAIIARGLTVSTLKHAHKGFDVDQPGKDSFVHRSAGASEVLVASPLRFALMRELRGAPPPSLAELLTKLSPVDLVLIEGFKRQPHPKLEVHREANGKPLIHPEFPNVVAIASDQRHAAPIPWVHIDDVDAIVDLLLTHAAPIDTMTGSARSL
jgi:molybdopterin-guanine dinucleotide biosynthesis adapter protein